ncbi:MAG: hypothetical protein JWP37_3138 [Mucilaginibacter sp.]|nr:hypothetical protein [Mucilaginibacter sp.]
MSGFRKWRSIFFYFTPIYIKKITNNFTLYSKHLKFRHIINILQEKISKKLLRKP